MRVCAFCRGGPACPPDREVRISNGYRGLKRQQGEKASTRSASITGRTRSQTYMSDPYGKPIPCFRGLFNNPLKEGVIFLYRRSVTYEKSSVPGFFNGPSSAGFNSAPSTRVFIPRATARIWSHRACGNVDARPGFIPHLPAFPARAGSGDSGMMVEPIALLENMEFPKNSINIDKLTGFFDKLTNIFEGKCEELRGWAQAKILSRRNIVSIPRPCRRARSDKCGELRGCNRARAIVPGVRVIHNMQPLK